MNNVDWEALKKAGHDLTFLGHLHGWASYACENCGSYVIVKKDEIAVFHSPPNAGAAEDRCALVDQRNKAVLLRDKIGGLIDADFESILERAQEEP